MKTCPNCQQQMDDNLAFCMNCGTQLSAAQPAPAPQPTAAATAPQPASPYANQVPPQNGPYGDVPPTQNNPYANVPPLQKGPVFDPYDHTAEFDAKDISG